jgi:hypothetical protein
MLLLPNIIASVDHHHHSSLHHQGAFAPSIFELSAPTHLAIMMSYFPCGLTSEAKAEEEEEEEDTVQMRDCFPRTPVHDAVVDDPVMQEPIMNTRSSRVVPSIDEGSDKYSPACDIPENATPPYQQQGFQARRQGTHQEHHQQLQQRSNNSNLESPHSTLEQFPHDPELQQRMKQLLVSPGSGVGAHTVAAEAALALMYSQDDSLQMSAETSSVRFLPPELSDNMDLDYVEEYDNAFNEFLTTQPRFLIDNCDLVHNMRIIKLQKHLTVQAEKESMLLKEREDLRKKKSDMEAGWHDQLRTAARKKAARETHLQSYLGGVHYNTKCMEAQLTWHMVTDVKRRAQNQKRLRDELQREDALNAEDQYSDGASFPSRQKPWLHQLPEGPEFDSIRDAMLAPPSGNLSDEQVKDVAQFQMDNDFLQRELAVLRKRVAHQKATTLQSHAWVESILQAMNDESLQRLKRRFEKKAGVPL